MRAVSSKKGAETMCNGPINALVCNKTSIQIAHLNHSNMSTCLSTQYNMQNEWTYAAA
jgi:hypothetical protein